MEDDTSRRIERMSQQRAVFLTGATGLLGRWLLHDLLAQGHPVAVLVRDAEQGPAAERIAALVDSWSAEQQRTLPTPLVLAGELGPDGPALSAAERSWFGRHRPAVVHAAANLSFRETADGEPWRTNVVGTESLLLLCQDLGISEWHQVSTAFVCGRRAGLIPEEGIDDRPSFHNPYEESKFQAEQLLRRTADLRTTVYRPSLIVGDSRTGQTTTFNGLYRFLELGTRLAAGAVDLPLRLPLRGDEPWDLVPVDWVSQAIVELIGRPRWHGHTFHLVSRSPVSSRLVRDVAAEVLKIGGVEFAGPGGVENHTRLEQLFSDGIQEYWPYLGGAPQFVSENTRAALPELPPPCVDRSMLERLIRFAAASRWGRGPRQVAAARSSAEAPWNCGQYIEQIFPNQARRSRLAREAGLDLTVGIDLRGPGGGQWSCKWRQGELVYAKSGLEKDATVTYHTDTATFDAVVRGRQTPQEAFFEQRISITGDLETALKLAVLFGQFLAETRMAAPHRTEVVDSRSFAS
jgi:thioester reductase-like protein